MRIQPYRTLDNVIEGAVITFVDITEAKKAQEALRESKSHFRQLAESLPAPVWMCLPDGLCDYLSPQWVEFTGVPEAQQLGFGWLDQVHPDDRSALMAAWNTAVAAGKPFEVEFRVRHHSGDYHLVRHARDRFARRGRPDREVVRHEHRHHRTAAQCSGGPQ